ncbi:hypothetical protein [Polaribacter sp. P097]|uniref:hypothetical protein n=1 Tax=Polaribacter sp. P097 TaxID=3117398 RepID=UPI002FE0BEBC
MASQYSTYTKPELEKKLKKQRAILFIQGFLVFLMIIFAVFSTAEKGVTFHTFLPLFFAPMFFVMYFEFTKIKKELRLRN